MHRHKEQGSKAKRYSQSAESSRDELLLIDYWHEFVIGDSIHEVKIPMTIFKIVRLKYSVPLEYSSLGK